MGLLDQLLSGGADRDRFDDFARRYDQGRPEEGYDDEEVRGAYGRLDREVDDDTYRSSARDAFERMGPDERREFKSMVRGTARERGHADLDADGDGYPDDPDGLAQYTSRVRQRDPDLLTSLLGGAAGAGGVGGLGGLLGGAGAAGALGSVLGGGRGGAGGGVMGNPVARAALAGIATMAVRRMTSR